MPGRGSPRWKEVAGKAARFHKARTFAFDGRDFDALGRALKQHRPESVLIVIPPALLDVNLHRRVLLLSATIDDDIFPD